MRNYNAKKNNTNNDDVNKRNTLNANNNEDLNEVDFSRNNLNNEENNEVTTTATASNNNNSTSNVITKKVTKENGQDAPEDYTFVEEYLPKVNEILEMSTTTKEWEELTKKFEDLNIPSKFNEKLHNNILKLTLKKYACNKNIEKSSDFFNWLISIVLSNKIDIESFKPCWKSFMLEKDENSYVYTKEDYPLLPDIAKNFIKAIELYDKNHLLYDVNTIEEMKNII